jgi:phosphatidylinositol alpha-1,6-mannosyltransferase
VTDRVLLLTPSRGLGGGIERFADTLNWAFTAQDIECLRVDLRTGGRSARTVAYATMLGRSRTWLRVRAVPTRIVAVHRALLPVAALLAAERSVCGISIVCHGSDVWGARRRPRVQVENFLMRRPGVRVVAASSFTAGALSRHCQATVLPPGISRKWFNLLVEASTVAKTPEVGMRLVTAFRLADWRGKGLPQLLGALDALEPLDVRLTVCGSGDPPTELQRLISQHPCCTLRPGLTDHELALQLAFADLFVLATRTRPGPNPTGEGFGLVLLEAQLAGTPVLAPAHGGSHDAFVADVTGVAPVDESTGALATLLSQLLKDPTGLARMGVRAAEWARESFAPDVYALRAVASLL